MNVALSHELQKKRPSRLLKAAIVLFLFCLLFSFFFVRVQRTERLELGSIASSSIVSPVTFDLIDEEATAKLRQDAVAQVGVIYQIDPTQISMVVPPDGMQDAAHWLESLQFKLWQMRFTDPITADLIAKFDPRQKERVVVITFFSLDRAISLPHSFWLKLNFAGPIDGQWAESLEKKVWRLQADHEWRAQLIKMIQVQVPQQVMHIEAGSVLVRQGQQITSQQLQLIRAMQEQVGQERAQTIMWRALGSAGLTIILLLFGIYYISKEHRYLFRSTQRMLLLVAAVALSLILAKVIDILAVVLHAGIFLRCTLFAPFVAILFYALFDRRIALFGALWSSLIFALGLSNGGLPLFMANLAPAAVAILSMRVLYRRKEIFLVCLRGWVGAFLTLLCVDLFLQAPSQELFIADFFTTFILMILTAVLVIGVLPLFESVFDVLTELTLMEYIDPSHPLLRRLMLEAPGTYQHSVVVGNLAEAAALAIGANGLFCRVSTLYHDIGKLIAPQFFTENQMPGVNVHQLLTPLESAQVIISHVSEGVAMALKAKLPQAFVAIIQEHHGTQLVYYFYHKQVELMQGRADLVNQEEFRYKGPKPRSKESAIIMIADSLEAASRSLDIVDTESVQRLVNKLVDEKADEGQFEDCRLTFEELKIVKNTLIQTVLTSSHSRIKYPKKKLPELDA